MAALRIHGRDGEADDATYHRVLPSPRQSILLRRTEPLALSARACWSSREVAGGLLGLLADAIAAVRRDIWHHQTFEMSRSHRVSTEMHAHVWSRMEGAIAHAR